MKILYDDQIFTYQHFGGISRYFCELMEQYSYDPDLDFRIALRYTLNEPLLSRPGLNRYWTRRNDFFSDSRFFVSLQKRIHLNVLNHVFRNRTESIRQLAGQDFDVFHPTYYDPYFLKFCGDRPFVLTVYDMIIEKFPEYFPGEDAVRAGKKLLAESAQRIIAISECTKKDIVTILRIPEEKVQTIYLAGSLPQAPGSPSIPASSSLPERYFLFVGNRSGYKNFPFLIRALAPVFQTHAALYLVCAGGGAFSGSERALLQENNMASRVVSYPADDITLASLYRNACAFIFPSLYEGFGLPVLEAFSCGCPAVLSNTSSLPEIGGDAALYFDPYDTISLADAMERVLTDESLRKELVIRGNEQGKRFSWEKTAAMTKTVYDSLASQ